MRARLGAVDVGDPRAGPREQALLPVERAPGCRRPAVRAALSAQTASSAVSRRAGGRPAPRLPPAAPSNRQREPPGGQEVDGARLELRAVELAPRARAGRRSRRRRSPRRRAAGGAGARRARSARAGRASRRRASRGRSPATFFTTLPPELATMPPGEHDGDADHEVAHRAVAVAARAREVGGEAGPDRRVAGRVEREHLAVLAEVAPGAPRAGSRPRRSRSGRPARARAPGSAPPSRARSRRLRARSRRSARKRGRPRPPRGSPAQRRSASPARSSGCAR